MSFVNNPRTIYIPCQHTTNIFGENSFAIPARRMQLLQFNFHSGPTNRARKFNTKKDRKDVRAWERTICNAVKSRHTKHGWHLNSGRNNLPEGCAAAVLRINMFRNFPHFPPRSEKRDGKLSRTGVLFLRYYEQFRFPDAIYYFMWK